MFIWPDVANVVCEGQLAGVIPFPPTHAMAWLLNPAAAACGTAEKEWAGQSCGVPAAGRGGGLEANNPRVRAPIKQRVCLFR